MQNKDYFQVNVRLPLWLKESISKIKSLGFSPSVVTAYALDVFFRDFGLGKIGRGRPSKSKQLKIFEEVIDEFRNKKSRTKV